VSVVPPLAADERAVVVAIVAAALFFAFLVTLLIWRYDVYKPTYDVRFAVTPIA
jgi:hypothetical protein